MLINQWKSYGFTFLMNRIESVVSLGDGTVLRDCYSQWPLSDRAAHFFQNPLPPPDRRLCYTMPGLLLDSPIGDPIAQAAAKLLGHTITRPVVQSSIDGLERLITTGNLRAAVDMTAVLLTEMGQGFGKAHSPSKLSVEILQMWNTRFQLLMALRMNGVLCSELETFTDLDAPDLYYQFYPERYSGKKGSLVPFSMRIIHVEASKYMPNNDAILRLYRLKTIVKKIINNLNNSLSEDGTVELSEADRIESVDLWKSRLRLVDESVARTFLFMKDYHLASITYQQLSVDVNDDHESAEINSLLGRLQIQLGSELRATGYFRRSDECGDQVETSTRSICHKAYLLMFHGNYLQAYELFAQIYRLDSSNIHAANNASVCLLYAGRLHDSIELIERILQRQRPTSSSFNESLLLNLCTLYELASARSTTKKQALLQLVAQYRPDSFSIDCLKIG